MGKGGFMLGERWLVDGSFLVIGVDLIGLCKVYAPERRVGMGQDEAMGGVC